MRIGMFRPVRSTAVALGVLLLVAEAGATTYYVRRTGKDSNSGTSPSDAWGTVAKAADTAAAGDVVYVGAGLYKNQAVPQNAGTAGSPIRFIADTSGTMTGDPGAVRIRTKAISALSVNTDYIEVVGFRLEGASNGAQWEAGVGGILQDCELDGNGAAGLLVAGGGTQLTIVRCNVHNNGGDGLSAQNGPSVNVSDSVFSSNGGCGLNLGVDGNTTFHLSACTVYANGNQGVLLYQGTGTIINGLIYDNGLGGVHAAGASGNKSLTIWNSTIASNAESGVRQEEGTLTLTNCIFADNGSYGLSQSAGTMAHTYNLVFGNTAGGYEGITADPTELSGDPLFVDTGVYDYHLDGNSPAIDAGTDAAAVVDTDLDGNPRPLDTGWDLGCYETPDSGSTTGGWRVLKWIEIDKP